MKTKKATVAALTIAGSDSGGGAGIQADLKTFTSLNVYGTTVITALTAQNTQGVQEIFMIPADFVVSQLSAVLSDISVQAVKTGMLGESRTISAIAKLLSEFSVKNLVVDPVMIAQSGCSLIKEDAVSALRDKLFPLSLVVTPNIPEAEVLTQSKISDTDGMIKAARKIHSFGPSCVLVKGGHLEGDTITDIYFDGNNIHHLVEKRINTVNTHGTGCTYSAAITACLARGMAPLAAVQQAKQIITSAIAHGIDIGSGGYGPTNPMGSFWEYHKSSPS